MKPAELQPWRASPFVVGRRYRVRRDFTALRDRFQAGEVLSYERDAWSRYDQYTGYLFSQPGTEQLRRWDIHDDEDLGIWCELFEEIESDDADRP